MRWLVAAIVCALVMGGSASGAPSIASSAASTTFVITGHGYGHGVGMGQWGAYGYALHGWSAEKILSHYYTGTTVGTAPTELVRVLLREPTRRVTIGSAGPWSVMDGVGHKMSLPAGSLELTASLQLEGRT